MTKRRSINPETTPQMDGRTLARLKTRVEREYARLLGFGPSREADIFGHATRQLVEHDNTAPYEAVKRLNKTPVPIVEFIENPEFLGRVLDIWPSLLPDLETINPDILVGQPPIHEAILGEAIGTGKTTVAQTTNLYQLYLLTCFDDVQGLFGLSSGTPIVISFQSVTPKIARRVIYEPFRAYFEKMRYARRHLSWNQSKTAALELSNNIVVTPEVTSVQANIGQADIGGILDEVNFMSVVDQSKRVPGPRGLGGPLDQAQEVYRHRSRRRKSRFTTQGFPIGVLCVLSSTRYEGDFLSRRIQEVERLCEPNVVVIRHSQYEVVPQDRFCGETFRLQVGNEHYPTQILADDEPAAEGLQVKQVPLEYKIDFQRDPENALRDIVGISSGMIRPFISQGNKIMAATLAGRELGLLQWVERQDFDLAIHGYPEWNEAAIPDDRDKPRFIHIDLSLTRDRCGVAVVKIDGMVQRSDPRNPDLVETLPHFTVECAFTLQPSPRAELDFAEVRSLLMQLKTHYGFNVRMISYDEYESRESIQFLRKVGIRSAVLSVDRTTEPYEHLRRALYQDRVVMVENELLMLELSQLEVNEKKGKIDHPPRGSKDLADAVAGAVFAASQDRRTRAMTGPVTSEGESPRERPTRGRRYKVRPRTKERRPGFRRRSRGIRQVMERIRSEHAANDARQDALAEQARENREAEEARRRARAKKVRSK